MLELKPNPFVFPVKNFSLNCNSWVVIAQSTFNNFLNLFFIIYSAHPVVIELFCRSTVVKVQLSFCSFAIHILILSQDPLSNGLWVFTISIIDDHLKLFIFQVELAQTVQVLFNPHEILNLLRVIHKAADQVRCLDEHQDIGRKGQQPSELSLVSLLPSVLNAHVVPKNIKRSQKHSKHSKYHSFLIQL